MITNKRNQNRTGQLSTHNIFINQLSQWRSLSKNKLVWRSKITLGDSKLNCSRQYVIISILLMLNNFIKNLFTTKSRDDSCVLFKGQATRPYRRTGMHFDFISCICYSTRTLSASFHSSLYHNVMQWYVAVTWCYNYYRRIAEHVHACWLMDPCCEALIKHGWVRDVSDILSYTARLPHNNTNIRLWINY